MTGQEDYAMGIAPDLTTLATEAATIHHNLAESRATLAAAERHALAAVLNACRPAWAALASRPIIAVDGRAEIRAEYRAVYLGPDAEPGPRRLAGVDERGDMGGWDLFWLAEGDVDRFVLLEYGGRWSRWQGEDDRWRAVDDIYHGGLAELPAEVLAPMTTGMQADRVAGRLAKRLHAVVAGKAGVRAEANRRRAERLEAVAMLLGARP